jgi:hypothetical protein
VTIIAKQPPRWVLFIALALALYTAVQVAIEWRKPKPASPVDEGPGLTAADTSDDPGATDRLVSRALAQIPPDSTEIKTGWRDEVRGIDLGVFATKQREVFLRMANAEACTCGCGFTLAACRENDLTCPVSLPRVEALRDSVLAGHIRSVAGLRQRPVDDIHGGVDDRSSGD